MAPPSGEHLQLRTLGAHAFLRADGSALALQRRPFALLAFVAASGVRGTSREKALGLLWPDVDDDRARHALAQTLYALRRACGADVIVGTTTLHLDAELVTADVEALALALRDEDASAVAALYHGPFLDGFHLPNAGEFERWAESERERIRAAVARTFERAATASAAGGDARAASEWWRRALALDPLDARIALALAESLATSGDVAAAVKQAELHQSLRRAELDLPPDPALAALVTRLRSRPHAALPERVAQPLEAPVAATPVVTPPIAHSAPDPSEAPALTAFGTDDDRAPRRTGGRRRWIGVGALVVVALVAAGAVVLTRTTRPLSDQRVVVAPFEDETGDTTLAPLGDMAADWVAGELSRTGLVQVVDSRMSLGIAPRGARGTPGGDAAAHARDFARSVGAGIVVWGEYYRRGDSIEVHSEISDVRDGAVLRDVAPIVAPAHDPIVALQSLAGRVMGALATIEDPRIADWAHRRGIPPSYAAYREFIQGLDADGRLEFPAALRHFQRSVALDSTFLDPLLFAVRIEQQTGAPAAADSMLRRLARDRDRLTPFDQLLVDFLSADLNGDLTTYYNTAREATRRIGTSESFLMAAQASDRVDRPHEAVQWFERIDHGSGWMRGVSYQCREEVDAAHLAGATADAVRLATFARRGFPDALVPFYCAAEARVGVGDVPGAVAEVDSGAALPIGPVWQTDELLYRIGNEMAEHGHPAQARQLWQRMLAWDMARPDSSSNGRAPRQRDHEIRVLLVLGRSRDALRQARAYASAFPADPAAAATLGVTEVAVGDSLAARDIAAELAHRLAAAQHAWDRGPVARAASRLAVALGNDAVAVSLLREALQDGAINYFDVHRSPAYDPLRRRPDFMALVTPRG